jgi:hypothetical protein
MHSVANMTVNWELIKQSLHLPDDTLLIGARSDTSTQSVTFLVEQKDLKPVEVIEIGAFPNVLPIITRTPESFTFDWNQK